MELNEEMMEKAKKLHALAVKAKELDEALSIVKSEKDKISKSLAEIMAQLNVKNFNLEGFGRYCIRPSIRARVLDFAKVKEELNRLQIDGLIQETINGNTLKAFVKEQLQKGNEVPLGIEYSSENMAVVTKE